MDVSREHIEIVQGEGGPKPRIKGHSIRVRDVVGWYEVREMSITEILEAFPTITRADVYAALAYYWDHKDDLDRQWAEADAWVEAYWAEYSRQNPSKFQEMKKELEEKWRQDAEGRRQEAEQRRRVG